jgi:hypothetical protein
LSWAGVTTANTATPLDEELHRRRVRNIHSARWMLASPAATGAGAAPFVAARSPTGAVGSDLHKWKFSAA